MAAIYIPRWPKLVELTTTLYPVDVVESVDPAFNLTGIIEQREPAAHGSTDFGGIQDGQFYLIRFDAAAEGAWGDTDFGGPQSGSISLIRFDADTEGAWGEMDFGLQSGDFRFVRIEVDTPDEELDVAMALDSVDVEYV